ARFGDAIGQPRAMIGRQIGKGRSIKKARDHDGLGLPKGCALWTDGFVAALPLARQGQTRRLANSQRGPLTPSPRPVASSDQWQNGKICRFEEPSFSAPCIWQSC